MTIVKNKLKVFRAMAKKYWDIETHVRQSKGNDCTDELILNHEVLILLTYLFIPD